MTIHRIMDAPRAYQGCSCSCHRHPRGTVLHVVACCWPRLPVFDPQAWGKLDQAGDAKTSVAYRPSHGGRPGSQP